MLTLSRTQKITKAFMAKVISVAIQKGGSGKTTTVVNLAAGLADKGFKVLAIDFDPQGNLTHALGVRKFKETINGALMGEHELPIEPVRENLDVVPANIKLAEGEMHLVGMMVREKKLKNAIKPVLDDYDFIIIDCPPSIGVLTINALTASDRVLIPLQAEYLATIGFGQIKNMIDFVKDQLNPKLEVGGVFLTQYDKRVLLNRTAQDEIQKVFKDKVYKTVIRRNITLAETPASGKDIFQYSPNSNGAKDYKSLVNEFLKREKVTVNG